MSECVYLLGIGVRRWTEKAGADENWKGLAPGWPFAIKIERESEERPVDRAKPEEKNQRPTRRPGCNSMALKKKRRRPMSVGDAAYPAYLRRRARSSDSRVRAPTPPRFSRYLFQSMHQPPALRPCLVRVDRRAIVLPVLPIERSRACKFTGRTKATAPHQQSPHTPNQAPKRTQERCASPSSRRRTTTGPPSRPPTSGCRRGSGACEGWLLCVRTCLHTIRMRTVH